ncbi:hypothetical protein [Chryseobacterium sp. S90]|uniref:hypothetical protein n=1 Tax=Chryseobacterium sp. S90 TaxID=3395373 RepID=UPI0039BC45E6
MENYSKGETVLVIISAFHKNDINEIANDPKNDPTNFVKKYRSIFGAGRGVSWPLEKTFNDKNRIPTTSAKQWAKDNIDWESYQ